MTKAMHRIQRKNKFLPYLLTLPSMLLFSMFTFYPFLKTVALSFFLTDKRGNPTKWAGISNWVRVLSKETFWKVIAITLEIAGINLVFTFGLAIFFALLSSQKKKGGKLYQTMYALPMAIASSPAAAIFLFIFRQKNGVVNSLLGGANIGWTTEMPYAMWAVCIMTIWMNVGISYIFLLVGFRAVPQDLIESAYLDGAGVWARIWHVMLPMASPQIFFVLFLNIAISFRSFAQIKLLTGGGPANATKNLIYYIYENAIINGRYETACVQAIFLFGLILLFTSLQFALEKGSCITSEHGKNKKACGRGSRLHSKTGFGAGLYFAPDYRPVLLVPDGAGADVLPAALAPTAFYAGKLSGGLCQGSAAALPEELRHRLCDCYICAGDLRYTGSLRICLL